MSIERRRELELKFLAGGRRKPSRTKIKRITYTDIEQVYLKNGWRTRKVRVLDKNQRVIDITYELNKKVMMKRSRRGVDSQELELPIPAELHEDLKEFMAHSDYAPVLKRRGKIELQETDLVVTFDRFKEDVLDGKTYLVEVEFDWEKHDPVIVESFVKMLFEDVVNVSAEPAYKNTAIAERIAKLPTTMVKRVAKLYTKKRK